MGSLCSRKPSATEVLTQGLYFLLCCKEILASRYIQNHILINCTKSLSYTLTYSIFKATLCKIISQFQKRKLRLHGDIWLDEGQKLVSNRLAQEFKDYQIQMQFHSILPHFVGKWTKLFPRSFPTWGILIMCSKGIGKRWTPSYKLPIHCFCFYISQDSIIVHRALPLLETFTYIHTFLLEENTYTHLQCFVGFFYIFYFKFWSKKIINRSKFQYTF